jgi:hypothetical protein
MLNIRQGLFETNSSSSHSFSINIANSGRLQTIVPDKDGNLTIKGGDFSEAEFYISDAWQKANAIAVYCLLKDDQEHLKMFEEVLLETTGAAKIIYLAKPFGQGMNSYMGSEFISYLVSALENKEKMKQFIFDSKSHINASIGYDG